MRGMEEGTDGRKERSKGGIYEFPVGVRVRVGAGVRCKRGVSVCESVSM